MSSPRILALAALAVLPVGAAAQPRAEVFGPGARVRVWAPAYGFTRRRAEVSAMLGDTLVLTFDSVAVVRGATKRQPAVTRIPVADIERIEVMTGEHPNVVGGLKTGVLIGGGIGLALGVALAAEGCDEGEWFCYGPEVIPQAAVGGALWGMIIGIAFGALDKTESWQQVWLTPPVGSGTSGLWITPQTGGIRLGMTLRL